MPFGSFKRTFFAAFLSSSPSPSSSATRTNSPQEREGSPSKKPRLEGTFSAETQAMTEESSSNQIEEEEEENDDDDEEEVFYQLTKQNKGKERESELEAELTELRERHARLYQESKQKYAALDRVNASVECVFCHDILRNPQVLECGHSSCYMCLRTWWTMEHRDHLLAEDERSISTEAESEPDDYEDYEDHYGNVVVASNEISNPGPSAQPESSASGSQHPLVLPPLPPRRPRHHFRPVVHYHKRCPECQMHIIRRPVPDYRLRQILDASRLIPLSADAQDRRRVKWNRRVDMWRGIFPPAGREHEMTEWFDGDEGGLVPNDEIIPEDWNGEEEEGDDQDDRGGDDEQELHGFGFGFMDGDDDDPILQHWAQAQARADEEARERREAEMRAEDEAIALIIELRRNQGANRRPLIDPRPARGGFWGGFANAPDAGPAPPEPQQGDEFRRIFHPVRIPAPAPAPVAVAVPPPPPPPPPPPVPVPVPAPVPLYNEFRLGSQSPPPPQPQVPIFTHEMQPQPQSQPEPPVQPPAPNQPEAGPSNSNLNAAPPPPTVPVLAQLPPVAGPSNLMSPFSLEGSSTGPHSISFASTSNTPSTLISSNSALNTNVMINTQLNPNADTNPVGSSSQGVVAQSPHTPYQTPGHPTILQALQRLRRQFNPPPPPPSAATAPPPPSPPSPPPSHSPHHSPIAIEHPSASASTSTSAIPSASSHELNEPKHDYDRDRDRDHIPTPSPPSISGQTIFSTTSSTSTTPEIDAGAKVDNVDVFDEEDAHTDFTLMHAMLHGENGGLNSGSGSGSGLSSSSTSASASVSASGLGLGLDLDLTLDLGLGLDPERYPVYFEDLNLPDDLTSLLPPPPPSHPQQPQIQPASPLARRVAFDERVVVYELGNRERAGNGNEVVLRRVQNLGGNGDSGEESESESESEEERLERLVREGEIASLEDERERERMLVAFGAVVQHQE